MTKELDEHDFMSDLPFLRPEGVLARVLGAESAKFENHRQRQHFYLNVAVRAAVASAGYRNAADNGIPSADIVRTVAELEGMLKSLAMTAGHLEAILKALSQTKGYDTFMEALNQGLFGDKAN